ncbi:MAG: Sir2 silent information regulator family NAD-dependent deacetylase [Candidatus Epulonipiscioides saccharophilum]|nr:MAG: Sir2 silent information regulator family NAD-dependent deacetylase [Epulopiscium sp. AS2M-Bin001]
MFSRKSTTKFTLGYSSKINSLKKVLTKVENVMIGAGAGLSTSAGLNYSGERFTEAFPDFIEKYGLTDMYSSAFYEFPDLETKWAYWSRHVFMNGYDYVSLLYNTYDILLDLVRDKNYFVITTNADHAFINYNFDPTRIFCVQGDYQLFQCSIPCVQETFNSQFQILQMVKHQQDMRVPTELLPKCPYCGAPAISNIRIDDKFVQSADWYEGKNRYEEYLLNYAADQPILYLELGVGMNTPAIIKYPFIHYTSVNPKATYAVINKGEAYTAKKIAKKSICINNDLHDTLLHVQML